MVQRNENLIHVQKSLIVNYLLYKYEGKLKKFIICKKNLLYMKTHYYTYIKTKKFILKWIRKVSRLI